MPTRIHRWFASPISRSPLILECCPAYLSGQYEIPEMEIDLFRLTQACGARLIVDQVQDVDIENQRLIFDQRPSLHYDALSIGIGSVPNFHSVQVSDNANLVKIKPMQTFLDRLGVVLAIAKQRQPSTQDLDNRRWSWRCRSIIVPGKKAAKNKLGF